MSAHPEPPTRRTVQRQTIIDAIAAAPGPLTVAEIHDAAQAHVPGMGLATVYRTVNLLLERNQIRCVLLPDGESRYEPTDRDPHHHFICNECRHVFDVDDPNLDPVPDAHTLPGGFLVHNRELVLYGTCPDCDSPPRPSRQKKP